MITLVIIISIFRLKIKFMRVQTNNKVIPWSVVQTRHELRRNPQSILMGITNNCYNDYDNMNIYFESNIKAVI